MQIHVPAHRIQQLINRLGDEDRRTCGFESKAGDLKRKLERIKSSMPEDCSVSLSHEELEGILL